MSKKLFDRRNEIMREFEFTKVRSVMEMLGWTWALKDKPGVPDIDELMDCADSLLMSVIGEAATYNKDYVCHATGGFQATFNRYHHPHREPEEVLNLLFYVTRE